MAKTICPTRRNTGARWSSWSARAGRPGSWLREYEGSTSAIRNWVRQADRDGDRREDGLTAAELEELRRLRRENRQLREEREILKRIHGLVTHGRPVGCRVLGVSSSGYYAWRGGGRSLRAKRDEELRGVIRALHEASRGTYEGHLGSRPSWRLRDAG